MTNRAAALRSQHGGGQPVARRGKRFIEFDLGGGQYRYVTTVERLHYGAQADQEIDTGWRAETGTGYDWVMDRADFKVQARAVLNAGDVIQWTDPQTGESVTLQPLALNWVNNANDSRQQITQPQAVTATASDDTLTWTNGYGTGRHFRYSVHPQHLIKHLIIDSAANLPAPTVANPYLEIEFILKKSAGVTLYVDGAAWDFSTRVATANGIEFRTGSGEVVWSFDAPGADDSAGNHTTGIFQLRRQGATRYCTVRIPKTWIDAATFPIYIDPTFTDGPSGDVTTAKDATISSSVATTNLGNGVTLTHRTANRRSLLEFDLSSIAATATVDSATLSVYLQSAAAAGNAPVYSLHSNVAAWLEGDGSAGSGATWNTYDGSNNWPGSAGANTSGTDYEASSLGTLTTNTTANAEQTVSLSTTRVAGWLGASNTNYGILLGPDCDQAGNITLHSSDATTAGYRPKLVVVYTAAGGSTYEDSLSLGRQMALVSQSVLTLEASLVMSRALAALTAGGATFEDSLALVRQMALSAASGLSLDESLSLGRSLVVLGTAQTDQYPTLTLAHTRSLSASTQLEAYASALLSSYRGFSASSPSGVVTFVDGYGGDVTTAQDNLLRADSGIDLFNYGIHNQLRFTSMDFADILRFNLSSIPTGSSVTQARLYLYQSDLVYSYASGRVGFNVITPANADWVEGTKDGALAGAGESCWASKAADGASGTTTAWAGSPGLSTSGTDYNATQIGYYDKQVDDPIGTEYIVDLATDQIEALLGGYLNLRGQRTSGNAGRVCSSEEATTAYRPKLVVEYLPPGAGAQTYEASLSLTRQVSVLALAQVDVQAATLLGRVLGVVSSPNLTVETSLSLDQRRALSADVNALYYTALTLAASLSASASSAADYEAAATLLRQMALTSLSEVGAQTYEASLSLARQLALSSATLATQFVSSDLGRSLAVEANANATMDSQLSLSRSLSLSFLGGLLLESAISLGKSAGASSSATLTAEASVGLGKSAGVSDSTTATLLAQLDLGRTVSLSPSVIATFETDAQLGKVLTLTIQGGLVYSEQVALDIFQALSTLSQLVQAANNFPAKLVIGDQTIWLLTATDRLASDHAIIDAEG